MLMIIRGTAVLIRRLLYIVLIVCLFLASAAIGAAYRDSAPNSDWKSHLQATFVSSKQIFKSASTQTIQSISGLMSDLSTFFQDLRGNKTSLAKDQAAPKKPPSDDSSDEIVVSVSSRTENEISPSSSIGEDDPLRWLSQSEDCSNIHQELMRRYGSAEFADEMEEKSRREEFRHVFREICGTPKFAKCGFELCSQAPSHGRAAVLADEEPIREASISEAKLEEKALPEDVGGEIPSAVEASRDEEVAPAPVEESPARKINVQRARMARSKASIADDEPEFASEQVEREIAPTRKFVTVPSVTSKSTALVAQTKRPVPSDDALAPSEIGRPNFSRQKFGEDVHDEPDEYRAILRKGQNARNSVENSEGR